MKLNIKEFYLKFETLANVLRKFNEKQIEIYTIFFDRRVLNTKHYSNIPENTYEMKVHETPLFKDFPILSNLVNYTF